VGGHNWEAGQLLAERYRLETQIGSGGMGEVWRAEHVKLRSPVAVKLLHGSVEGDAERSARFLREAQAAAAIRSGNVVQVLDYGVEHGTPFIAMEYLEGETLADRIERRSKLGASETARIVGQVARAIARAHKRGIVHRDLKPSNIFIVAEEDSEVVKVLDFGIAKLVADVHEKTAEDDDTQTGAMLGTPFYMSPEQARGFKELDHRADLWSLAIIAFECITGKRPISGSTVGDIIFKICGKPLPKPSSVCPVPIRFDAWFRKATQRNRDERFQSAKEMSLALRAALFDDNPGAEIEDADSVDWTQPLQREAIEMLDTLEKVPSQRMPDRTLSDSMDSWDETPEPKRTTVTDKVAPSGGSLTPANLSAALEEAPPTPLHRRRWIVAVAALVVVGIPVALLLGNRGETTPEPAATPVPSEVASTETRVRPARADSEPTVSASATPSPAPAPAPAKKASPRQPPPAAASSAPVERKPKIEFGI
jgi:serine/threonine protein kinase